MMNQVLYIHDPAAASELDMLFHERPWDFVSYSSDKPEKWLELIASNIYECVVCDDRSATIDSNYLLKAIKTRDQRILFILLSIDDSRESIIKAVANQVDSYILIDGQEGFAKVVDRAMDNAIKQRRSDPVLTDKEKHLLSALKASNTFLFEWEKGTGIFGLSSMLNRFGFVMGERPMSVLEASAFFDPDDLRIMNGALSKYPIGKQMVFPIRIMDSDGGWRWVELRGEVMAEEDGTPSRIIGTVFDITDSKRAAEEIERHHALLKTIVENINDAIFAKDLECRYLLLNAGGAMMAGVSSAEAIGKSDDFLFGPDAAKICREEDLGVMESGKTKQYDTTALISDQWRTFLTTKAPLRDRYGKVNGLIGITRDISNMKRAELALKESEGKFKSLYEGAFENISIFEMVRGADGVIVDWLVRDNNPAAQEYLGKPMESIVGKRVTEIFGAQNMNGFIDTSRKVMESGRGEFSETYFQWNGRYYMYSMFPIGNDRLATVGLDITERKAAEEALRKANRKLGLLNGVTRHDMTNQLMVVSGIVSLMELEGRGFSTDHLIKLNRSITSLRNQLEFMRQYQEIGAMAPEWQELHQLVQKAVGQLSLGEMQVTEEATGLLIRADPLFEKVVYNLVENAIRHGGGVRHLSISVIEGGTSIKLVFQDDGRGITDKEREYLFQPGRGKNTGFGLFLSKEILEITGMSLIEESTGGNGARFLIGVPSGMFRLQNL